MCDFFTYIISIDMNKPLVVAGVVLTLFSLTALALAWWSAYRVTQIQKTMNTADKNPTLDSHTPSGDDSPTPVHDQSQDALVMTKPITDEKYTLVTLGDLSVNRQAYNGRPVEIIDYMDTGPLPHPMGRKSILSTSKSSRQIMSEGLTWSILHSRPMIRLAMPVWRRSTAVSNE